MPPPPAPGPLLFIPRLPRTAATAAAATAAPWAPPAASLQHGAFINPGMMPFHSAGINSTPASGGFGAGTPASSAAAAAAATAIRVDPAFPEPLAAAALSLTFRPARKHVLNEDDLRRFLAGGTARSFVSFLLALNASVSGLKLSDAVASSCPTPTTTEPTGCPAAVPPVNSAAALSPDAAIAHADSAGATSAATSVAAPDPAQSLSVTVAGLCAMLAEMSSWMDDFPPLTTELRYGNPAFRSWAGRLGERAETMLRAVLPVGMQVCACLHLQGAVAWAGG